MGARPRRRRAHRRTAAEEGARVLRRRDCDAGPRAGCEHGVLLDRQHLLPHGSALSGRANARRAFHSR